MELICDYREKKIIELLKKKIQNGSDKFFKNYKNINVISKNLHLGDFEFGNVILERKTHQDLASSILDGRYKEQCFRLSEYKQEHSDTRIVYIIEGNFDLFIPKHNIDKDKLLSAIISIIYEKGFYVIMTKHMNETVEVLLKFCHKYYTKYKDKDIDNNETNNIIDLNETIPIDLKQETDKDIELDKTDTKTNVENIVKQNRKKNSQISKENIGIIMLANIPNISATIATELLKPFDNDFYGLLNKIKTEPEYLETIKLQNSSGKYRKLNKNIIEQLKLFFM